MVLEFFCNTLNPMKTIIYTKSLAALIAISALLPMPGVVQAQSYRLFGISGKQQSDQIAPGVYDHKDHTLFQINTSTALLTEKIRMTWVIDSDAVGYCDKNGLIYHTASGGAYRDGQNAVHDQDPLDITPAGAFQDNTYMESLDLLTLTMTGVYNANPCPNPDNPTNEINLPLDQQDGLYAPCFGLAAPIPPWVLPQYRRNTTQTSGTNRITGPNEVGSIRGLAWSTELNSWYVSNGDLFKMSLDGMTCTNISTPAFVIPTDDLSTYPTGLRTNADLKAVAFIKTGGQTKLFGTWRADSFISGNTNGWIMEIDPVTGANIGQIALNYPPGGGDPVGEFSGLLGLAQNPQTGEVYGIRKTGDAYARELVKIDLATGNTTLVGVLTDGAFGQAITTLAFAPDILITSITKGSTTATINWTGAAQPTFSLLTAPSPTGPWTTNVSGLTGPSTTVAATASQSYYRIQKP